jgi:uncharacterized protein YfiM (DUF2279 family)
VIATLALAATMATAAVPWPGGPGPDKVKHFLVSALVQSTAYSVARSAGVGRANAQWVGGVSTMTVGVLKEVRDKRSGQPFSVGDLVWDAGGGLAAASLLNGTR